MVEITHAEAVVYGPVWVDIFIPPLNGVEGGYTSVTLSVCPPVDRIVSAMYLPQY